MSGRSEPGWEAELREQLDALSGSRPDLDRAGSLRAVIVSLVEVHRAEAYQRGLMAGRSQAGYTTRRKKKEEPCPTSTSAPDATGSAASAGEP